ADVLFTMPGHPITRAVIAAAPRLRFIATLGTGFDNIDLAAARERGIPVTNAPGILDETTADAAFGLLIAAARRIGEGERILRAGGFRGWTPFWLIGQDVHGATLGLVGLGRIGTAVARRARGFGMRILYHARHAAPGAAEVGAELVPLERLLAESDFVSLHVPLSPETRHLIDARRLALMKRTAILVNTARGPVVDEKALAEALAAGTIAGAALDVYEREPAVEPALLRLENVVLAPHLGSASQRTRTRMAVRAAENICAWLDGRAPLDPVPA
ncbi:MAG: D-glycerate dehydrogenase, partial [Chloroflexi bacterium]|nr:D-glycerate dehydrogenase [Chloroflexota bacterium]